MGPLRLRPASMLTHITSFLNHGELAVAALAYSKKQELLLV